MYQYPKPGALDYGSPPNPETITALERSQHLDKYDLDKYIPSTTRQILNNLHSANVTAQEDTRILRQNGRKIRKVWKELCYGKAETLVDAEEAARWWRYNLVR